MMKLRARSWSLGARMAALFSGLLAAIGVFMVAYFPARMASQAQDSAAERAASIVQVMSTAIGPALEFDDADNATSILGWLTTTPDAQFGVVQRADGSRFAAWHPERVPERRAWPTAAHVEFTSDLLVVTTPIAGLAGGRGTIHVGFSLAALRAERTAAERAVGMVSALVVIAGVLATMLVAALVVRPIRKLTVAARGISRGELPPTLPTVRGSDEVAQMAEALRAMLDRVEARTRELDERNRGMRMVLDNVAQGFITIDPAGVMASERSAIVDSWFGAPPPSGTLADLVRDQAPEFAEWLELGLDEVREAIMPLPLLIEQLPARFAAAGRTFDVAYSPILRDDSVERILVIVSDMTEQLAHEQAEREQRELVALFQRITADRPGFEEFMAEASGLVDNLDGGGDRVLQLRALHTLKGNCGMYGLERFAALCHALESELIEAEAGPLDDAQRIRLVAGWREVVAQTARLLGERSRNAVEVDFGELSAAIDRVRAGASSHELAAVLTSWTHEPVARRFERLAQHAGQLARKLGKPQPTITISGARLRLDAGRWAPLWNAMIHIVRNAVDHGFETAAERAGAGKPAQPTLSFVASHAADSITLAIADDGRGIDWDAIRERGMRAGLPCASQAELVDVLLSDGISTRDEVTATSGRGVGMAALRDAVTRLGGTIVIDSQLGRGTTVVFRFGVAPDQVLPLRAPTQPIRLPMR